MKQTIAIILSVLFAVSLMLVGCAKEPVDTDLYADIPETPVEDFELGGI